MQNWFRLVHPEAEELRSIFAYIDALEAEVERLSQYRTRVENDL